MDLSRHKLGGSIPGFTYPPLATETNRSTIVSSLMRSRKLTFSEATEAFERANRRLWRAATLYP